MANHVPINAKIIGTHEHESHYVFDLLYNKTSDIRPERHSTDTHGSNQVNSVAWRHVNLFGTFEFNPAVSKIDIDTLVARYADPAHWNKALKEENEEPLG